AQVHLRALTAADVIEHCEEARRRLGAEKGSVESFALDWDIANAREAGRDFGAALAGYEQLLATPVLDSVWEEMLDRSVSRCRLALRRPSPPDLSVHPFDRPFYWA